MAYDPQPPVFGSLNHGAMTDLNNGLDLRNKSLTRNRP